MAEKKNDKELKEKELDGVAGGGWWASKSNYKSGDTPLFKVGDIVIVNRYTLVGEQKLGAVIKSVSTKKSGTFYKEFTYTVEYGDGETEDDIYESQMV